MATKDEQHFSLRAQSFRVQPVCGACDHWRTESVAPECRTGTCCFTQIGPTTPETGWCYRFSLNLIKLRGIVSEDYAARYFPEETT
jgi:hypothetical protein